MRFNILTTITLTFTFLIAGCSDKDIPRNPLSEQEIEEYWQLKEDWELKKKRVEQYEAEEERIKKLEETYLDEYIQLVDFSLYKTNSFDDGRSRVCYTGSVQNNGDEIVSDLELTITLNHEETGEKLGSWSTAIVRANDEFLNSKDRKAETRALFLALEGKRLPLKPKSKQSLDNNRTCMKEVILGWSEKSTEWALTDIELRPKLEELRLYHIMDDSYFRMGELYRRGIHFGQLNKDNEKDVGI